MHATICVYKAYKALAYVLKKSRTDFVTLTSSAGGAAEGNAAAQGDGEWALRAPNNDDDALDYRVVIDLDSD